MKCKILIANTSSPTFHYKYFIANVLLSMLHSQHLLINISSTFFITNTSQKLHRQHFNTWSRTRHHKYFFDNTSSRALIANISSQTLHCKNIITNTSLQTHHINSSSPTVYDQCLIANTSSLALHHQQCITNTSSPTLHKERKIIPNEQFILNISQQGIKKSIHSAVFQFNCNNFQTNPFDAWIGLEQILPIRAMKI